MKISSKTTYALRTILDLAQHAGQGVCRVSDIAGRQDIPQKFLEQILLLLKGAGIVDSKRGARGGYFLARSASDITLASIVTVTDDSFTSREGVSRVTSRMGDPFDEVWARLGDHIDSELAGITMQDMKQRADELVPSQGHHYVI